MSDKLKIPKNQKDPTKVSNFVRNRMVTNASLLGKKAWEKKYPGYNYSDFYQGG